MSKIDPYVAKILQKHLPEDIKKEDAVWFHKQSGQWIAKHRTLEIIAAKCDIVFDDPKIIESNVAEGICVVCVMGRRGLLAEDDFQFNREVWSIGEASPKNCMNQYPAAMAEKRAKDRVILKLLGLHGYVYSDQEIDTNTAGTALYKKLLADMESCEDNEALGLLIAGTIWTDDVQKLTEENRGLASQIRKDYTKLQKSLSEAVVDKERLN